MIREKREKRVPADADYEAEIERDPELARVLGSGRSGGHKDAPDSRPIEPPELGVVIRIPEVGGLHHRYVRRAA